MLRTFMTAAVSALALTAAAADETVKFSSILHATYVESQEVGDVDGHAMSLTRYSGLARFSLLFCCHNRLHKWRWHIFSIQ